MENLKNSKPSETWISVHPFNGVENCANFTLPPWVLALDASLPHPWCLASWQQTLNNPQYVLFLLQPHFGFALIQWISKDILHLQKLVVHPNCKRLRLGTQLLAEVKRYAVSGPQPVREIWLETPRENEEARAFYQKMHAESLPTPPSSPHILYKIPLPVWAGSDKD